MTKHFHLSPTEREIIWMLGEAGEETLPAAINTVSGALATRSRGEVLMAFEFALRNLYRQKLIDLCSEIPHPGRGGSALVPLTEAEAARAMAVGRVLGWDEERGLWRWDKTPGGDAPVLVITDMGREALGN